jgi:hypothetical protein
MAFRMVFGSGKLALLMRLNIPWLQREAVQLMQGSC